MGLARRSGWVDSGTALAQPERATFPVLLCGLHTACFRDTGRTARCVASDGLAARYYYFNRLGIDCQLALRYKPCGLVSSLTWCPLCLRGFQVRTGVSLSSAKLFREIGDLNRYPRRMTTQPETEKPKSWVSEWVRSEAFWRDVASRTLAGIFAGLVLAVLATGVAGLLGVITPEVAWNIAFFISLATAGAVFYGVPVSKLYTYLVLVRRWPWWALIVYLLFASALALLIGRLLGLLIFGP